MPKPTALRPPKRFQVTRRTVSFSASPGPKPQSDYPRTDHAAAAAVPVGAERGRRLALRTDSAAKSADQGRLAGGAESLFGSQTNSPSSTEVNVTTFACTT